jgi:hypothetical protein
MLQVGEIQTIIGDTARNGVGGQQYCGVWSLTSKHRQFNAFGNSYAGLIPAELRGKAPKLEVFGDRHCRLTKPTTALLPVEARADYHIVPPYYIDHTFSFRDLADRRSPGCDFREVSWCSYMNCPEDPRLHFLSGGEWHSYISPGHGIGSNIAPGYIAERNLEVWPKQTPRPFHWERASIRFDEPFYYGRLGEMALIFMFDHPRWLRFFCSPSGGGGSLVPGQTCPAWDFEWVIPASDYKVGHEYTFRVRMAYKRFVSNDDVLAEFRAFQQSAAKVF